MATVASASLTAQNTYTTVAKISGYFNVSISGTFEATVFVQRSTDNATWMDVDSYTAATEVYGFEPEVMYYRIGIKTGGFTSGTAVVRLGREDTDQ